MPTLTKDECEAFVRFKAKKLGLKIKKDWMSSNDDESFFLCDPKGPPDTVRRRLGGRGVTPWKRLPGQMLRCASMFNLEAFIDGMLWQRDGVDGIIPWSDWPGYRRRAEVRKRREAS